MPRQRRRWPAGSAFAPNPTLVAVGKRCPALGGDLEQSPCKEIEARLRANSRLPRFGGISQLAIERRTSCPFRAEI